MAGLFVCSVHFGLVPERLSSAGQAPDCGTLMGKWSDAVAGEYSLLFGGVESLVGGSLPEHAVGF